MNLKDINRHVQNKIMTTMFVITSLATLATGAFGTLTMEYVASIGLIYTYLGNHTYNHMKTSPSG